MWLQFVFIYAVELVLFSLITFGFYAWDKRAARQGNWRIPESQLHLLALLGGWPGAMIGQRVLRHKTNKFGFQLTTWIIAICHTALFIAMSVWISR